MRFGSRRVASISAAASGGNSRFGIATTARPAAWAERMPLLESSTAAVRDREIAPDVAPYLLALDERPVEVEDHEPSQRRTFHDARFCRQGFERLERHFEHVFDNDDPAKRAAGYAAVDRYVHDGECIGLGTGTTAFWAIKRVGERVAAGERIVAVPTSSETERLCRQLQIPIEGLLESPMPVAIDGADEVAPDWSLTKGGGGALFREKAVALSADRFVVVCTDAKLVPALGRFPLPVEIVPYAEPYVRRAIGRAFGAIAIVRRGTAEQPFLTDNGNWIFDCAFGRIEDARALDERLRSIHGVVSTGLFYDVADDVIVGSAEGARSLTRRR